MCTTPRHEGERGKIAACNAQPRSATITVPAGLPAGDAVLQWLWQGDGTYENCADITITGGAPSPAPTADQAAAQRVLQAQATSVGLTLRARSH